MSTKPQNAENQPARSGRRRRDLAPQKLQLLVTVVGRQKTEFFIDYLQEFEVNMQLSFAAQGTAPSDVLGLLGLSDTDKSVIFSIIKEELAPKALSALEEKFNKIKGGKGIAFTVPLTSTIGVAIYQFLANIQK